MIRIASSSIYIYPTNGAIIICRNFASSPPLTDSNAKPNTVTSLSNDGILTIRMNRPKTLNAWTEPMLNEIRSHFENASTDNGIKAIILTGTGKYYCAGVNLSGMLKPMHPAKLHKMLCTKNRKLFDMFLDVTKPIIAAVNGPAIGASVTSASLCDAIIAADRATFSTPFARLGIPPEGCSSVHFARIMGDANAERMLGSEGWTPSAKEAKEMGLVHAVVPSEEDDIDGVSKQLCDTAHDVAQEWIKKGKARQIGSMQDGGLKVFDEYKAVNAKESIALSDAFLSADFLEGQRSFLSSRGKRVPALMFSTLLWTRPLWGRLVPPPQSKNEMK